MKRLSRLPRLTEAFVVAGAIAFALRLATRRPAATPEQDRWRELSGPDFR